MKKITLLLAVLLISVMSFGQSITGIGWVNWGNEPNYPETFGYAENPYDAKRKTYTVLKAPAAWAPIATVTDFDATWDLLGVAEYLDKITDSRGGDLFDLGTGNTFGASWKAVHDGSKLYVLLKYWDVNNQAEPNTKTFEVMSQPTSPVRHEASFTAAADSAEATRMAYRNMAYARAVELGGGKALFKDGVVSEFVASVGLTKTLNANRGVYEGAWGANTPGLEALLDEDHFWDATGGIIRAVLVMTFDGALSYPNEITAIEGARTGLKVGDTFAFDIKSNSRVGGTENVNRVEYFWSADNNQGYAANYYSGHVTISSQIVGGGEVSDDVAITGIGWVNWANEPNYPETFGYAENPYDAKRKTYTVLKAPSAWTPVTNVATFDATWDVLGETEYIDKVTDSRGGDLFDLGTGNTFGAGWKAVHDGSKMYVLLKYWDVNNQAEPNTKTFEVMSQPTSPVRHDVSFTAAADSAEATKMAYRNMAYARAVELGGGKALFKDGAVSEFVASVGLTKSLNANRGVFEGAWGANTPGLEALLDEDHFWDATSGIIRAVLVMTFDGALSYPVEMTNIEGARIALKEGETFSFDIKTNSRVGGTENVNRVEYFWSADNNQGYAANYYSGHVTISGITLSVNDAALFAGKTKVYLSNGVLYVRNSESVDIEVFNLIGSKVKAATNVNQLTLQDLTNGVYLVRVNGEGQAVKVVKH